MLNKPDEIHSWIALFSNLFKKDRKKKKKRKKKGNKTENKGQVFNSACN